MSGVTHLPVHSLQESIFQGVTRLDHEADNLFLFGAKVGNVFCYTFMHLHGVLPVHRDYVENI